MSQSLKHEQKQNQYEAMSLPELFFLSMYAWITELFSHQIHSSFHIVFHEPIQ